MWAVTDGWRILFPTVRGQFQMSFSPGPFLPALRASTLLGGSRLTLWSKSIVVRYDFHLLQCNGTSQGHADTYSFSLPPLPFLTDREVGTAYHPATSPRMPVDPREPAPIRTLSCHRGLQRCRNPCVGGYRNRVRALPAQGILPEGSSWGHHPSASHLLLWALTLASTLLHCKEAVQGLALPCQ